MRHYSRELKESMVAKLCLPGGPSALQLSKKTGISQTALSRWKREFGNGIPMKNRKPHNWTLEERLKAVFEAQALNETELGEFLRKQGLHSNQIEEWKAELTSIVSSAKTKPGRPRKDPELVAAEAEIKELKRDLRRKEKALAEQTALVILQKKAQEIWGKEEDEE